MKFTFSLVLIALINSNLFTAVCSGIRKPDEVQIIEEGRFHLFIWRLQVGEERYTVERNGDSIITHSNLEYTYTQKKVSRDTTLQTGVDFTPRRFDTKGTDYLGRVIDVSVSVEKGSAIVRQGGKTERVILPNNFFSLETPLPATSQMMLFRYWNAHGHPASIKLLPNGEATIEYQGRD